MAVAAKVAKTQVANIVFNLSCAAGRTASDESGQAPVQRPEWNGREQGSSQQMRVDPANAFAE
jgi:hypothetical protein